MKYLLPIFFSIFFVACFGINKDEISQNNSLKYPSWYLNPPLNDGNMLYGVGVANTKQEAILNALDDLSSRLMLTIESNQEISLKSFRDYREYVSKTTIFNINTKSEKLTFKDYKIEDFYSFQKEIFYLISIKKSDLINSLNSQISNLYDEYEIIKRSNDDILNKNIKEYSNKELAKIISYVPQTHQIPFDYTVFDVVLMGRLPHIGLFSNYSQKDRNIATSFYRDTN